MIAARLAAWGLVLALAATAPASACDLATAPSTRWSIVHDHGAAWLKSPCGERLLGIGVDVVDAGASGKDVDRPHYDWQHFAPSRDAWVEAARQHLADWGFNSAGAWSLAPQELRLPTTINLELGRYAKFHWFDPFDPATALRMRAEARRLTAPYRDTPYRIGYFSDNEVGWWSGALFTFFSKKPASNHTKQRWAALMRSLYGGDFRRFAADFVPPDGVASWPALLEAESATRLRPGGMGSRAVSRWTATVAQHYYALAAASIKAADPTALFLGDRLPIYYDPAALRVEAPYVDAIAVNYNVDSPEGWIAPYFFAGLRRLSGAKPVFVSEWFYAARENRSGNRNNGHLMTVETQSQRAAGAAAAASRFAAIPELVGLDWFQYYDYPQGGRADREDYDFGLVDINDQPYQGLVDALSAANRNLPRIHAASAGPPTHVMAGLDPAIHPAAGSRVDARVKPGHDTGRRTGDGIVVPEAVIDPAHRSLVDWPKPASLLPALRAAKGDVAFGEVYLSWSDAGLAVAIIGQDYYDPDLLAYDGKFPLSESFRVELGVEAGAGPRRFTLAFVPPSRGGGDKMTVALCAAAEQDKSNCPAVDRATALYFGADQPRLVAEALLPWSALGLAGPPASRRLRFEVAAQSWYRARWMSLSGVTPTRALADPRHWAEARLGPAKAVE